MFSFLSCRKDKKDTLPTLISVDEIFIGNWSYIYDSPSFSSGIYIDSTSDCHFKETNYSQIPIHKLDVYGVAYIKNNYIVVGDSLGLKIYQYPIVLTQNDTISLISDMGSTSFLVYSATMVLNGVKYHKIEEWYE